MEKGWNAAGRLEPLWQRVGGRDALAKLTGITGNTLSSYNTGKRPLGIANARRIAEALGVSVYDLGARRPHPNDFARALLGQAAVEILREPPDDPDLLEELATEMAGIAAELRRVAASLRADEPHGRRESSP